MATASHSKYRGEQRDWRCAEEQQSIHSPCVARNSVSCVFKTWWLLLLLLLLSCSTKDLKCGTDATGISGTGAVGPESPSHPWLVCKEGWAPCWEGHQGLPGCRDSPGCPLGAWSSLCPLQPLLMLAECIPGHLDWLQREQFCVSLLFTCSCNSVLSPQPPVLSGFL